MGFFKNLFGKGLKGRSSVSAQTMELIKREWEQIDVLLGQKGPSQLRQALIKADKTLDNVLRDIVPGDTMGERLKSAREKFDYQTYDKIWKAHLMRNSLIHESGFDPPHHMVTNAIENLKTGLRKLGIRI